MKFLLQLRALGYYLSWAVVLYLLSKEKQVNLLGCFICFYLEYLEISYLFHFITLCINSSVTYEKQYAFPLTCDPIHYTFKFCGIENRSEIFYSKLVSLYFNKRNIFQ